MLLKKNFAQANIQQVVTPHDRELDLPNNTLNDDLED